MYKGKLQCSCGYKSFFKTNEPKRDGRHVYRCIRCKTDASPSWVRGIKYDDEHKEKDLNTLELI